MAVVGDVGDVVVADGVRVVVEVPVVVVGLVDMVVVVGVGEEPFELPSAALSTAASLVGLTRPSAGRS